MVPMTQLLNAALENSANCTAGCAELRPRTNVLEGDNDFRLVMDLPGVTNEDLEINVEDDVLSVKADRAFEAPEGYKARRNEWNGKVKYRRHFTLGNSVDTEKVSAKLEQGVLTITLAKSSQSMPRRIEVQ